MTSDCEHCGCQVYQHRYYDKMVAKEVELGYRFKQMRAHHGMQQAEWELRELDLVESTKWLQRKTKKQAEVIRKLEEKLRKLNQRPYEESPSDE